MLFTDISAQRAIKAFNKAGFWISKSGGKHVGMANGSRKIIIPRHSRLNPYTLKAIIRDAGLTDEEFAKLF
jgi:predicted RNA binding protein YcfA (HicA-like mRNA interferase family)